MHSEMPDERKEKKENPLPLRENARHAEKFEYMTANIKRCAKMLVMSCKISMDLKLGRDARNNSLSGESSISTLDLTLNCVSS